MSKTSQLLAMRCSFRLAVFGVWGIVLCGAPCAAQSLDDATVLAAIHAGESGKLGPLVSDCVATAGFGANMAAGMAGGIQPTGSFDVVVSTNEGRIAYIAAEGKRLHKRVTPADIPEELRGAVMLYVTAVPQKPEMRQNYYDVPSLIEHVVLKSKKVETAVVQPQNVEKEQLEWANLMGGKIQGNQAVAAFDINLVKELPLGDIDIVLVTQAGERRCKIGMKDRAKLVK